jgi:hypothetical protein
MIACACLCGAWLHAQPRELSEYQAKALFIFNFVQFVEWPESAFTGPGSPLYIGVLGDDPFNGALVAATEGEKVKGRSLVVVSGRAVEDVKHCHVVFVCRSERLRVESILGALERQPTLTIGDTAGFGQLGGVVNFYRDGEKIRFEINREAAQIAGLRLSAQLLRLAKHVGPLAEAR